MNNRILDDDVVTAIGIPTIRVFSSMAASATRSDRNIAVDHILALVYLRAKSMVEKELYGDLQRTRLTHCGLLTIAIFSTVMFVP